MFSGDNVSILVPLDSVFRDIVGHDEGSPVEAGEQTVKTRNIQRTIVVVDFKLEVSVQTCLLLLKF